MNAFNDDDMFSGQLYRITKSTLACIEVVGRQCYFVTPPFGSFKICVILFFGNERFNFNPEPTCAIWSNPKNLAIVAD